MQCPYRCLWFCPEVAKSHVPFCIVFIPDLVLGCCWGPGHYGYRNWGGCAATWDLACLYGRALLGPLCPRSHSKLHCEMELECSCWERNHCILLSRGCVLEMCNSVMLPATWFACQQNLLLPNPPLLWEYWQWALMSASPRHALSTLTQLTAAGAMPRREHADNGAPAGGPHTTLCALTMGSEVRPSLHSKASEMSHTARWSPLPGSVPWNPSFSTSCCTYWQPCSGHVWSGKHCKVADISAGLSLPWLLASQHVRTLHEQSSGPTSPSVCPGRPPRRQGGFAG